MKRVAYVAANNLTVAGLDFPPRPSHMVHIFSQIFKCLGTDRCVTVQGSGTPSGGAREQHTSPAAGSQPHKWSLTTAVSDARPFPQNLNAVR